MSSDEHVVWGIHAGRAGDADSLFKGHNCIALGWEAMGDVSKLPNSREAFKAKAAEVYPSMSAGALPVQAGQVYRYVHEMKVGDYVVYPSKIDRLVHIGKVTGEYKYCPGVSAEFPQQRAVKWLRELPRTRFTQGALYEIGSAMSFFQVKSYAEEFLEAIKGKAEETPKSDDPTVKMVAGEIEETTRDFVLKTLSRDLKGHPFAHFAAHLLECMGYRTRVSPEGPDGGVDIVAHKDELGFEPPIIKVQVKSSEGSIGEPVLASLYGKVSDGECGLFITLGSFTPQARSFGRSKSNLRIIDGQELVDLVILHYEQFDSRYKGLLPLKKVYVPEAIEETE